MVDVTDTWQESELKPYKTLIKDESSTSTSQKSDIKLTGSTTTEQLTQLNDLYKAGVLTEEEFTKAKKKILD